MAEETVTLDGKIVDALPNAMFRVELENGHNVLAYLSGKMLSLIHISEPTRPY